MGHYLTLPWHWGYNMIWNKPLFQRIKYKVLWAVLMTRYMVYVRVHSDDKLVFQTTKQHWTQYRNCGRRAFTALSKALRCSRDWRTTQILHYFTLTRGDSCDCVHRQRQTVWHTWTDRQTRAGGSSVPRRGTTWHRWHTQVSVSLSCQSTCLIITVIMTYLSAPPNWQFRGALQVYYIFFN